ncbi:MAG: nucleoside hydrolase [Planctomycetota bacterium]|jgi:inosine-uridine nucleoside N-ribohydrolase
MMRVKILWLLITTVVSMGHFGYAQTRPAISRRENLQPIPVILDTDIGGDIDDTWALAFLLACRELDLKLVTTATGNTPEKAKIAAKLLEVAGRTDVPVGIGIKHNDRHTRQIEWVKDYDLNKYPGKVHKDGVQATINTIMKSKDPITLIAVGPVTNVAEAIKREPSITKRAKFIVMGGCIGRRPDGKGKPESNVRGDPKAAQIAYSADWDFTMAPLNTAGRVKLSGELYANFRDSKNKLAQAVLENFRHWVKKCGWYKNDTPDTRSSTLFDTVAVYLAFDNKLCEMRDLNIKVDNRGYTLKDPQGKLSQVALKWKNLEAFKKLLVQRIINYQPKIRAPSAGAGYSHKF